MLTSFVNASLFRTAFLAGSASCTQLIPGRGESTPSLAISVQLGKSSTSLLTLFRSVLNRDLFQGESHILWMESKLASSRQSLQPVVFREEVLLPPLLQENVVSVVVLVGDEFARLLRRERQRIVWEMNRSDELDMYLASIPSMCKYLRTIRLRLDYALIYVNVK